MKKVLKKRYIFILLILISIGFAYLTSNLSLSGISSIFRNTWDVHFENVVVSEGSVEANTPVISNNDTSVTFSVELDMPGDFYEFTVDAVNAGTIDAMLDTYTSTTLTEDQQKYLEYTATYADGEELAQYQELNAGDTLTYKIRLYYKIDIQEDDLPSEDTPVEITFTSNFIQADSNRIQRYAETHSLYNVLKNEADSGGLAKKYTGAHQDSMDASLSTKDIYHWYADNNADGDSVKDKNNVIFANHCWQMIRTTDTGGTKLIYNGEVENNKCLNTRGTHVGYSSYAIQSLSSNYWYGTDYIYDSTNNNFTLSGTVTTGEIKTDEYTCRSTLENGTCSTLYNVYRPVNDSGNYYVLVLNNNSNYSQFGTLPFNQNIISSLANVGYMYNEIYRSYKKSYYTEEIFKDAYLSTGYWFAHNVVWGNPTANNYNLDNPYRVSSSTDYPNLVGEYTFINSTQTYTKASVYYIAAVSGSQIYYIELDDSGNHTLADFNYTYTYGDSYTDNGNGTYTINNATTINRTDWRNSYSNIGANKYLCKNAINNTCSDLWYTTFANQKGFNYIKVSDFYKYAKGFIWDGSKYVLNSDTSVSLWNYLDSTNLTNLKNAHYTCWNSTGECTSISFVYYIKNNIQYYVNLTNGKSIEDAKNEMLYNDDVNAISSTIKTGIDAWYKKYLLNYSEYIEDTIFCNNRSTDGWNPNGGSMESLLAFSVGNSLSCLNDTDRFSTLNNKAKLKYKVGLLEYTEMILLNNSASRKTGQYYWLLSPRYYAYDTAYSYYISSGGALDDDAVGYAYGVRPAISLKPGTVYSSGDGSMDNPYVVTTN